MNKRMLGVVLLAMACSGGRLHPVAGDLKVEPEALDFGKVPRGTTPSLPLELRNDGLGTLRIVGASVDDPAFALSVEAPFSLVGAERRVVQVKFTPGTEVGVRTSALHLSLEQGAVVDVELSAEVVPEQHPDQHQWVLFDSNRDQGNRDLYAVRPDGSGLKRLTRELSTEIEPTVSPDGKRLAFASDRVDFTMQLFVLELATGAVTQVTHGLKSSTQPAWSPDGKRLAFHRDLGVYTIAVDGSDEVHVIDGLDAFNSFQFASYLPGGSWLLMSRTNEIDMVRVDGTDLRQVVQNDLTQIAQPSASPSGSTFAFAAFCGGGLSVRSASTSTLTNACSEASQVQFPGRRPAWGPGFIAYETTEANSDIQLVPATGGTPVTLAADPADDRNPSWAPMDTELP